MKILHLETSSKNCSVAISDGETILCVCEEVSDSFKQSENLHTFVEWALEGAEITLQDIHAVNLGKGPGSYTGLRIGASAAKGFAFALQIPLVAVNSMHSMVEPFLKQGYDVIIPLVDARRMEVYTLVSDGTSGEELQETTNLILDETSFAEFSDKNVLFVGDGCVKAQEVLKLPNATFKADVYPSAKFLIREGNERLENNQTEDIAYFEPFYLKEFQGVKLADKTKKS